MQAQRTLQIAQARQEAEIFAQRDSGRGAHALPAERERMLAEEGRRRAEEMRMEEQRAAEEEERKREYARQEQELEIQMKALEEQQMLSSTAPSSSTFLPFSLSHLLPLLTLITFLTTWTQAALSPPPSFPAKP
jgi:hypothetical protein